MGMSAAGMIIDDPGGVVYLVNLCRSVLDERLIPESIVGYGPGPGQNKRKCHGMQLVLASRAGAGQSRDNA
jgi:hypothetical protein